MEPTFAPVGEVIADYEDLLRMEEVCIQQFRDKEEREQSIKAAAVIRTILRALKQSAHCAPVGYIGEETYAALCGGETVCQSITPSRHLETDVAIYAHSAQVWQSIETAPAHQALIINVRGKVTIGWVERFASGDEEWTAWYLVTGFLDCVKPAGWQPLPPAPVTITETSTEAKDEENG